MQVLSSTREREGKGGNSGIPLSRKHLKSLWADDRRKPAGDIYLMNSGSVLGVGNGQADLLRESFREDLRQLEVVSILVGQLVTEAVLSAWLRWSLAVKMCWLSSSSKNWPYVLKSLDLRIPRNGQVWLRFIWSPSQSPESFESYENKMFKERPELCGKFKWQKQIAQLGRPTPPRSFMCLVLCYQLSLFVAVLLYWCNLCLYNIIIYI